MKFRVLTPFITFPLIIFTLSYFGVPTTLVSFLSVVGGFLVGGLAEYFLHRVAFHNRKLPRKIKRLISNGHISHHRNPQLTDNLVLPLSIVLPISLVLLGCFVLTFGTLYAFWFYVGVILSYFLYEFLHYSAHHMPINLPLFNQLREYHLSHHRNLPNSRFMVTNPLFDIIFRSYK